MGVAIGCVFLCCLVVLIPGLVVADGAAGVVTTGAVSRENAALRDTLIVTGKGVVGSLPLGPGLVTRVNLREETGARDLADVLATVAGLQLRRFGGSGAGAVPSMRGSGPAQVRILIDGLAMDDAEAGMLDLTRLPWDRFRRADIYRGLVPARLGGASGAGAINLVTDTGTEGLAVRSELGAFGDRAGRLTWGSVNAGSGTDFLVMVHARSIDNDYTYSDHLQTFNRTDDDTLAVRRNAQWQDWGLWSTGGWSQGDWKLRAALGTYGRSGGRPGPMGVPTTTATVDLSAQDGRLSCQWRDGLLVADVAARRDEEHLFDEKGEVLTGFTGTVHSVSRDLTLRLVTSPVFLARPGTAISHLSTTVGVQWRHQDFRQNYDDLVNPLRTRSTWTLFGEGNLGLIRDRLHIVPGWRWRRSRDDFPPLPPFYYLDTEQGIEHVSRDHSPSLGITGEMVPDELYLRVEFAKAVRQPTWIEMFGHRGGLAGNRDLESEENTSVAAGLTWQPVTWPVTLRATGFQSTAKQTIVYVQNSPGTSMPVNAGASETRGLELEAVMETAEIRLAANATWQRARDESGVTPYDGKELPYLPAAEVWARASRAEGALRPYLTVAWQDGNFRDRANTPAGQAPSRTIVGAGMKWNLRWGGDPREMEISVGVLNLTDNQNYDVEGFPLPGRSWRTAVEIRF